MNHTSEKINRLLGGKKGETISYRIARQQDKRFYQLVGKIIEWVDKGHLERSLVDKEKKLYN